MNYARVGLAFLGGFVVYFAVASAFFAALPSLKTEFARYPGVYRDHDGQMARMPLAMAGIFLAILAMTVIYSLTWRPGYGAFAGAHFGMLVGLFAIGTFTLHNYANLNIGGKLAAQQSVVYFVMWVLVGTAIGAIYRG